VQEEAEREDVVYDLEVDTGQAEPLEGDPPSARVDVNVLCETPVPGVLGGCLLPRPTPDRVA
jgi:hypothetical protein